MNDDFRNLYLLQNLFGNKLVVLVIHDTIYRSKFHMIPRFIILQYKNKSMKKNRKIGSAELHKSAKVCTFVTEFTLYICLARIRDICPLVRGLRHQKTYPAASAVVAVVVG
jgi:hypothetical protein